MTNEFIDELGEYLSKIDDYLYNDTKNSIEKINIITNILHNVVSNLPSNVP